MAPLKVFISSACRDLLDLRWELFTFLKERGLSVKISENPRSGFFVDTDVDAIDTCLKNVEDADVVVAIIDRQYGTVLNSTVRSRRGKSATHVEIAHARKRRKPVLYFIRDVALADFHALNRDRSLPTLWVECDDECARSRWFDWVQEVFKYGEHANRKRWYDLFRSSVELKEWVWERLVQKFRGPAVSLAMQHDRLVRLAYNHHSGRPDEVLGTFKNVGVGPAFDVRHGMAVADKKLGAPYHLGGVPEGETTTSWESSSKNEPTRYKLPKSSRSAKSPYLYCEWENRFGDTYALQVPLHRRSPGSPLAPHGREKLLIRTIELETGRTRFVDPLDGRKDDPFRDQSFTPPYESRRQKRRTASKRKGEGEPGRR